MKNPSSPPPDHAGAESRAQGPKYGAGTYLGCSACGRLLRIHWPTRSVVCSCGARVSPVPASDK